MLQMQMLMQLMPIITEPNNKGKTGNLAKNNNK